MQELRVWWIPQVPGKQFQVPVKSVEEGVLILDTLANYDIFQYDNHIKPDYCNAGGLQLRRKEDCDACVCSCCEWEDWYDEETGCDDPAEWVASMKESE